MCALPTELHRQTKNHNHTKPKSIVQTKTPSIDTEWESGPGYASLPRMRQTYESTSDIDQAHTRYADYSDDEIESGEFKAQRRVPGNVPPKKDDSPGVHMYESEKRQHLRKIAKIGVILHVQIPTRRASSFSTNSTNSLGQSVSRTRQDIMDDIIALGKTKRDNEARQRVSMQVSSHSPNDVDPIFVSSGSMDDIRCHYKAISLFLSFFLFLFVFSK